MRVRTEAATPVAVSRSVAPDGVVGPAALRSDGLPPAPYTPEDRIGFGPLWVGSTELTAPPSPIVAPADFAAARLLVTIHGVPAGQVTVALEGGYARADAVRAVVERTLGSHLPVAAPLPHVDGPLTVVVATRNRATSLGRCLRALQRSAHDDLSVLVVDNDPDDDAAARAVSALADPRVTYVWEPRRGTSRGRNRGLVEAERRGAARVAFIDDDVEVEPGWAGRIVAALAEPGVACVCGPVFGARLDTAAQRVAETALGFGKGFVRRTFSLAVPPPESLVFPFSPGLFGVGANLAVRVDVATALGGFDVALGPGTRARAGEDCDFLVRLVLAGHALRHEPSAYVWHHHRTTEAELSAQLDAYAVGLGAFLAAVVLDPRQRAAALRRLPAALGRLREVRRRESPELVAARSRRRLASTLLVGPLAYVAGRRD